MKGLALFVGAAALVSAQELKTPVGPLVFDQSAAAVRPVMGFLGGASLGAKVADADQAWISSNGLRFLTRRENAIAAWAWDGESARNVPLNGTVEDAVAAAWAADGSAALLAGARFQFLRFQSDFGDAESSWPAPWTGQPSAVALTVSGDEISAWVVVAGEGVYRVVSDGSSGRVFESAASLVLAGRQSVVEGQDLVTIDGDGVRRVALDAGSETPVVFTAASVAGDTLFAASGVMLRAFDRNTGARILEVELDAPATEMSAVRDGLFRLNARASSGDPILLANLASGAEPKIWFVPGGEAGQ